MAITFKEGVRDGFGDDPSDWEVSSMSLEADLILVMDRVTLVVRVLALGLTTATRRRGDLF